MGIFAKLAAMGAVIAGGSLLTLWLAFGGHLFLSWLALFVMAFLALLLIVFIAKGSKNAPIDTGSSLVGLALAELMHLIVAASRRGAGLARKAFQSAVRAVKNARQQDTQLIAKEK